MLPALDVTPPTTEIWTTLFKYYLFLGFSAGAIVTVWMIYNIVTYRASKVKEAPKFHEESGWGNWKTVVMTLMVTGTVLGFVEYETFASVGLITPPSGDPLTINVTGQQFVWSYTYPDGYTAYSSTSALIVPQNMVVILNITSKDVDHSFSIQTLDVAKDALPGQYNSLWFNATQTGTFVNDIRCKELCGVGHAFMIGNFTVLSPSAYNAWYATTMKTQTTTTVSSSAPPTGPTQTVTLPAGIGSTQTLNFQPDSVTVAPGTTIVFVNKDTSIHNIYFTSMPAGASIPSNPSPNTPQWTNGEYTVTLTVPGTYTYICQYHSWMKGTIVVS